MSAVEPTGFSARIARRQRLWWDEPVRWTDPQSIASALHRLRERHMLRSHVDPEAVWHCCPRWQRTLINKWNSRELAKKLGCRVPELYWHGRAPWRIPFADLPPRYVVRPVWGTKRRGIFVVADGRELLRGEPATAPEMRRRVLREHGLFTSSPLLVEEFICSTEALVRLPLELKVDTFVDTVAAICALERNSLRKGDEKARYYTTSWQPIDDPMRGDLPRDVVRERPEGLQEMIDQAIRIGAFFGGYVRVDFFATERGCVFNELSSTPSQHSLPYTPLCNAMYEDLWLEKCPESL